MTDSKSQLMKDIQAVQNVLNRQTKKLNLSPDVEILSDGSLVVLHSFIGCRAVGKYCFLQRPYMFRREEEKS